MRFFESGGDDYEAIRKQFNITYISEGSSEDLYLNFRRDGSIFYCSPDLRTFMDADLVGRDLQSLLGNDIASRLMAALASEEEFSTLCTVNREEIKLTVYCEDGHGVLTFETTGASKQHGADGDPAAIIARELSNYLSVILAASRSAMLNLEDGPEKVMIASAEKNSLKALRLARNIRDIAAFNSGVLKVYTERQSFTELCHEIAENSAESLKAKGIEFETDIPQLSLMGDFDKEHISRAIYNLITNAAASAGKIKLTLKYEGGECLITVSDNGRGIPFKYIRALRSTENTGTLKTVTDTGGAGYGLLLARAVTLANKGRITVNTGETGSCITLCFPASEEKGPARLGQPRPFFFGIELSDIELSVI